MSEHVLNEETIIKEMEDFVLREETYAKEMEETVIPYLLERKKELWLESVSTGKKLYYVRYLADNAVGTVVISHGFTETAEKYQEVIYYFLKLHYHVYIMEHCGHGNSYRMVEDLSLVHVDSCKRYMNNLISIAHIAKKEQAGLPLFLYSHSMGGGVSAAVLAKEPGLFEKAVLSSPMIRPLTGDFPWPVAKTFAKFLCMTGKREQYVPGGHAFDGNETFEDSAAACRERFDFYQQRRNTEALYQMSSPSCGWLNAAADMEKYLRSTAWKQIKTPLLIFQADNETFVCNESQDKFADKIRSANQTTVQLVHMPETKHEIFNSSTEIVIKYFSQIFIFISQ